MVTARVSFLSWIGVYQMQWSRGAKSNSFGVLGFADRDIVCLEHLTE